VPLLAGIGTYAAGAAPYVRAGTLTTLVADSDVEHFADVIGALLAYPIGWSVEAQMGLEATPVGLAYHYVHASISALTGADTFSTAVPSHLLMLSLAPSGVYLFARSALSLSPRRAAMAAALFACGGLGLGVAGLGWGQQTAALATLPVGLAGTQAALVGTRRDALAGGLLAALAAGALYLASVPAVAVAAMLWVLVRAARGAERRLAGRTALFGGTVLAAGALSHLSAAGFFLTRGGLQGQDVAGRSTHVAGFASHAAALAVQPLDLFASAERLDGIPLAAWQPPGGAVAAAAVSLAGLVLILAGCAALRRNAFLVCVTLAAVGFEVYLRLLKPFPYGEFKLLTSVWFLVPCLAAAGYPLLASCRYGAPGRAVGALLVATFAWGLLVTQTHVRAFVAAPWGAALPEREMRDVRAVVGAVPAGNAVWVSNQLAPAAAVDWQGAPTLHRAGFASQEAGAGFLAARWRGAATALLTFSGRPAYGTVQRHSTELRAPIDPRAANYVLLDESEDPLLLGLVDADLVLRSGRLLLYRSPAPSEQLPPTVLPIGESLPGRRQGLAPQLQAAARSRPLVPDAGPAYEVVGLFAARETEVELRHGEVVRRVALFPGLTWYAAPLGVEGIEVRAGPEVRATAPAKIDARRWVAGETLFRSVAGVAAPLVLLSTVGDSVEIAYVNLTADLVSTEAHFATADTPWLHGRPASGPIVLDPLASISLATLTGDRRAVVWLEVGPDSLPAKHALPLDGAYSLPLLGRRPALERLEEGTLVKGSSARLYTVEGGRLRWVPTLEALQRRGPPPRIVTLPDVALWRLPVGLPLD
jgi:hypothetical protein